MNAEPESEILPHSVVADLHTPRPGIFWLDLAASALVGWGAFVLAIAAPLFSWDMLIGGTISGFALYRGACFTHELAHLRRRALPGFETTWNLAFGVPLLLPSFTYLGVHQSHHSLSTYGTKDDPEYLPFANSRRLMIGFAVQSSLLLPVLLVIRFLVLSPIALLSRSFHKWLEVHASSFAMNPEYRRSVAPEMAHKMRRWEVVILLLWGAMCGLVYAGTIPVRVFAMWLAVSVFISFLNTIRVLGAHEYETDGTARTREGQLGDSIDTPGGPWTELWAPVGLRYHALHHYYPGIPYHNLGAAYRRIVRTLPARSQYLESTSPSLRISLATLYAKAKRRAGALRRPVLRTPRA
jgi:fatty acid desaturase